jgi:hypothetical protein
LNTLSRGRSLTLLSIGRTRTLANDVKTTALCPDLHLIANIFEGRSL